MKKIIVLAYSKKEFNTFMYENRTEGDEIYIYGDSFQSLAGTEAQKVIVYGTFWDRPDAKNLYELANSRVK